MTTTADGFEHVSPDEAPEALSSATPGRGGVEPGGEGPDGTQVTESAAAGDDVLAPATPGRDGGVPAGVAGPSTSAHPSAATSSGDASASGQGAPGEEVPGPATPGRDGGALDAGAVSPASETAPGPAAELSSDVLAPATPGRDAGAPTP